MTEPQTKTEARPEPVVIRPALTVEEAATLMNALSFSLATLTSNPEAALQLASNLKQSLVLLTPAGCKALADRMTTLMQLEFGDVIHAVQVPADDTARATTNPFGGAHKNEHVA